MKTIKRKSLLYKSNVEYAVLITISSSEHKNNTIKEQKFFLGKPIIH